MWSILFFSLFGASIAGKAVVNTTEPQIDYGNLTVAIVRAPPANWPLPILNMDWTGIEFDLNATVDLGVQLIEEAADNGANLVVFPELWFPGYPKGMGSNDTIGSHITSYIKNSLVVDSPQWKRLITAARDNKVYVVPGFSHLEGNHIFMAQALISPEGEPLYIRHKLRPSGGERTIFSDGTLEELKVIATPYGRWGILECWEHFHPSMTINVQAQAETLHIGAWPYTPDFEDPAAETWETLEVNLAAARVFAISTGAPLVFASIGNVRFLDQNGLDIVSVDATVPFDEMPLLYSSFNTTGLAATLPYKTNGEQSWGILQQIRAGFPSYIPKVAGSFVKRQVVKVSELLKLQV